MRKLGQGIDFLGYIVFFTHRLLRTRTKKRLKNRLRKVYNSFVEGEITFDSMDQRLQSYLGILSHANTYNFSTALKNAYWLRSNPDFRIFPFSRGLISLSEDSIFKI